MPSFNQTRAKRKSIRAKRKSIRAKRKSIQRKRKKTQRRNSIRRQQKGGRSTFFPNDMVNTVRTISSGASGILNTINGVVPLPPPGPTLGHINSQ